MGASGHLILPSLPISRKEGSILPAMLGRTMGLSYLFHTHTHTHTHPTSLQVALSVSKIYPLSSTSTDPHTLPRTIRNLGRLTGSALNLSEPLSLPPHHHSQAVLSSSLVLQGGNSTPASRPLHELICLLSISPLKMSTKEGICIFYLYILYKYTI